MRRFSARVIAAIVLLFAVNRIVFAEPTKVQLTREGEALVSVSISPKASDAVKASAKDLANYLGRMSGCEFKVEEGDGGRGIVLGCPQEFDKLPFPIEFGTGPFEREDYLLRSHGKDLYLLGASDLAVSHAVWDILHRLGYRQFFPGETWEVVPRLAQLQVAIDERASPSFHARRIWYNWGL